MQYAMLLSNVQQNQIVRPDNFDVTTASGLRAPALVRVVRALSAWLAR